MDCDQPCLREAVVHIASYHGDSAKQYNERNPGLGLRFWKPGSAVFWTVGGYLNSLDRPTLYAGAGIGQDVGPVSFRIIAAGFTGYMMPVAPGVVPELGLRFGDVGIAVNYLPRIRFNGHELPEVAALSLTVRF